MNSPRIMAAAKALCAKTAEDFCKPEDEVWDKYTTMFIKDAAMALQAADKVEKRSELERQIEQMQDSIARHVAEEQRLRHEIVTLDASLRAYRERFGLLGQMEEV